MPGTCRVLRFREECNKNKTEPAGGLLFLRYFLSGNIENSTERILA